MDLVLVWKRTVVILGNVLFFYTAFQECTLTLTKFLFSIGCSREFDRVDRRHMEKRGIYRFVTINEDERKDGE